MYELILVLLIAIDIALINTNKTILVKSYIPKIIKIILIFLFLIFILISRKYATNKIAISFPLLIFILFHNTVTGGIKKDGVLVFLKGKLPCRKYIKFKNMNKIDYKINKEYIILSIYTNSSCYIQYFSLVDKEELFKNLQRNKIKLEKKK